MNKYISAPYNLKEFIEGNEVFLIHYNYIFDIFYIYKKHNIKDYLYVNERYIESKFNEYLVLLSNLIYEKNKHLYLKKILKFCDSPYTNMMLFPTCLLLQNHFDENVKIAGENLVKLFTNKPDLLKTNLNSKDEFLKEIEEKLNFHIEKMEEVLSDNNSVFEMIEYFDLRFKEVEDFARSKRKLSTQKNEIKKHGHLFTVLYLDALRSTFNFNNEAIKKITLEIIIEHIKNISTNILVNHDQIKSFKALISMTEQEYDILSDTELAILISKINNSNSENLRKYIPVIRKKPSEFKETQAKKFKDENITREEALALIKQTGL